MVDFGMKKEESKKEESKKAESEPIRVGDGICMLKDAKYRTNDGRIGGAQKGDVVLDPGAIFYISKQCQGAFRKATKEEVKAERDREV